MISKLKKTPCPQNPPWFEIEKPRRTLGTRSFSTQLSADGNIGAPCAHRAQSVHEAHPPKEILFRHASAARNKSRLQFRPSVQWDESSRDGSRLQMIPPQT